MDYDPPFLETYKTLLEKHLEDEDSENVSNTSMVEKCEYQLPLIDLERLLNAENPEERDGCMKEISEAASEWGFFQVINHGIPKELLENMHMEQRKLFHQPFVNKSPESIFTTFPAKKTYRWGNPCATNLSQLSWSEAFHLSLTDISSMDVQDKTLRSNLEAFATSMASLAESLAEILAHKLNMKSSYFKENGFTKGSFIRLNRYPPCPISSKVYGLLPHSDTSFLTIVYQNQIGGLQFLKDGKWIDVKPNPQALMVNIGDLFQALSNGVYKSIYHRVVAVEMVERFSMAFFYSPSDDAIIQSHNKPAIYKKFTLKEYKKQNAKDVKQTGDKVGLSNFVL